LTYWRRRNHFSTPDKQSIMQLLYYMPFKPMGHHNPSGDLVTGTELFTHLQRRGHDIRPVSRLRCRWIYYRPLTLLRLLTERVRIVGLYRGRTPDLWLSYHSYYKAPDLLGPGCARRLGIPYTIFQGIYSTKRKKQWRTLPGFLLNRASLRAADRVFTNKKRDLHNLQRLLPPERLSYIAPGIQPEQFRFSLEWRAKLRHTWGVDERVMVMTAAMMRPGVKTAGIAQVISAVAELYQAGLPVSLVVAGDGSGWSELHRVGKQLPGEHIRFLGRIPREELSHFYSAADIFAFPGVDESLGMVYLEAQSCRLPVVALEDWGGGEAVLAGKTGMLSPASRPDQFTINIAELVRQPERRRRMGEAAAQHIVEHHDLQANYAALEQGLQDLTGRKFRAS
jgi:glycosyltransferase involved in cell wall biosynthesis